MGTDGVLVEKSLSNVHTPTIRRCGPLYQQQHCQVHADWVESLKQAGGVSQALVIGEQTAWYPPGGASRLPLLIVG